VLTLSDGLSGRTVNFAGKLFTSCLLGETEMVRKMLRDDQYERVALQLPGKSGDRGRTAADNRDFVEAVLWIARTGSPWRDLPEEFGLWNSVYKRFSRWSRAGVWHTVFAELAANADFEEVFIDSTIVRAHQHAAGAPNN
jgi:transposase